MDLHVYKQWFIQVHYQSTRFHWITANITGCSDIHVCVWLCLGDKCNGLYIVKYRIWIRATNRFELRFSDRNTFWCRDQVPPPPPKSLLKNFKLVFIKPKYLFWGNPLKVMFFAEHHIFNSSHLNSVSYTAHENPSFYNTVPLSAKTIIHFHIKKLTRWQNIDCMLLKYHNSLNSSPLLHVYLNSSWHGYRVQTHIHTCKVDAFAFSVE